TRQHGASGLTARVRESQVDLAEAERQTLEFLRQWVPGGTSPMCGNSICQDRRFLARLMPQLERYFHYRNLDVSTVKELARRWAARPGRRRRRARGRDGAQRDLAAGELAGPPARLRGAYVPLREQLPAPDAPDRRPGLAAWRNDLACARQLRPEAHRAGAV